MEKKHSQSGSFVRQAAILAAASLVVRFLGFLYRLPLTTMIGDIGNGIYSSGYNIYTFLLIVSSAGMPAAISKMVSERITLKKYEDAHNVFKVSLIIATFVGVLSALILFFGAEFLSEFVDNPDSYLCIITLSPTVLIVAVMSVFRGYFQGLNTTVPTAFSQVFEQIFNAVFSVYLAYIFLDRGIKFAAAGGTAGTGIGALAGLIFIVSCYYLVRKDILRNIRANAQKPANKEARKKIAITLIKTAFPIIVGTAIFSITNIADMKMVMSLLLSSGHSYDAAKALYGQLSGKYVVLTTLPVSFATALATAVVPNIAATIVENDEENVKRKINLALRITMIISIPAATGIGVLGDQILVLLWPTAHEGGILLQAGAAAIVFLALAQISTGILQGMGKVFIPAAAAGVGAIVKIALNSALIPITSINVVGAVLSTIGCYTAAGLIDFYFLQKLSRTKPDYLDIFVKPLFASVIMGISCYSIFNMLTLIGISHNFSTIIAIVVAVITYILFMFFLRGIRRSDILIMPNGDKILKLLEKTRLM